MKKSIGIIIFLLIIIGILLVLCIAYQRKNAQEENQENELMPSEWIQVETTETADEEIIIINTSEQETTEVTLAVENEELSTEASDTTETNETNPGYVESLPSESLTQNDQTEAGSGDNMGEPDWD